MTGTAAPTATDTSRNCDDRGRSTTAIVAISDRLVYGAVLTGLTALVVALGPSGLFLTVLGATGAWLVTSVALGPGRRLRAAGFPVAVTTALVLRNTSGLPAEGRMWAVVVLIALVTPLVVEPLGRIRYFPFLHIWCVFEGIYVYISALIAMPMTGGTHTYTAEERVVGYRLLAVFTIVLVANGIAAARLFRRRRGTIRVEAHPVPPSSVVMRCYIVGAAALAALAVLDYLELSGAAGQLSNLLVLVAFVAWATLTTLWLRRRLALVHGVVVAGTAGLFMLSGLGSGLLYRSAMPAFLLIALLVVERRRVPWVLLLVGSMGIVLLNVGKAEFRQSMWVSGQRPASSPVDGLRYASAFVDDLTGMADQEVARSATRFATSNMLGYFGLNVPATFPYWGYGVYASVPELLVPRVLLPDKGSFNVTNSLGKSYRLITGSDDITAVNTPLFTEAYAAGGLAPMLAVGALSGVFMAVVGRWLWRGPVAHVIVGACLSVQLMRTIESGILGFVLVVPFLLALRPVARWICGNWAD